MLTLVLETKLPIRFWNCALTLALLAASVSGSQAKGYSSGGHSYSSSSHSSSSHSSSSSHTSSSSSSRSSGSSTHFSSGGSASKSSPSTSTHSSSSGTTKTYNPGSGRSYGSGSTWSDDNRKSYSSGKSYSAGSDTQFSTTQKAPSTGTVPARKTDSGSFAFDTAAARARREQASKQEFTRFKEASKPAESPPLAAPVSPNRLDGQPAPSYAVKPPPLPPSATGSYRPRTYVLDDYTMVTRPARVQTVFMPYISRPVVVYRDPYNSFFWWWLLDRSLDDRAYWAYHHRYDMDPARYDALVAHDRDLDARVQQLETQQLPRNPNYVPPNVDRDLMYSDQYVARSYTNRPTTSGSVIFWLFAIPAATAMGGFLIWVIFFKRWRVSTA